MLVPSTKRGVIPRYSDSVTVGNWPGPGTPHTGGQQPIDFVHGDAGVLQGVAGDQRLGLQDRHGRKDLAVLQWQVGNADDHSFSFCHM